MSDFDKEAEREKLREKYERDKADREATQRMSDLLLKGATMTNAHCGTCGDPLFEQDGTTFCPSCHGSPDAVQGTDQSRDRSQDRDRGQGREQETDLEARPPEESAADDADANERETETERDDSIAAAADESTPAETPSESPAGTIESGGSASDPNSEPNARSTTDAGDRTQSRRSPTSDRDVRTPPARVETTRGTDVTGAQHDEHHTGRPSSTPRSNADLEDARASLVAALEKFSRNAAETDDPRYAKECLEAAREASEALDVLR